MNITLSVGSDDIPSPFNPIVMKNLLHVLILTLSLNGFHLLAQPVANRTVTGIVVDETNSPIIFAMVIEKNLNSVTSTDLDGKFSIQVPDTCKFLEVHFTGYSSSKVNIEGKDSVIVILKAGITLDEVHVIAYKVPLIKQDNTTSLSNVTGKQIRNRPTKNLNAIAATTAGTSNDGQGVNIRGSRSNATSYYVDGVKVTGQGNAPVIPNSINIPTEYFDSAQREQGI